MNRGTQNHRAWLSCLLCGIMLLPLGCASSGISDSQRELLHNELRGLEDLLYELEGEVKDKDRQLDAAKREMTLIKEEMKALSDQRMKAANDESRDVLPAAPGSKQPIDRDMVPNKPGMMGTIEEPRIEAPALPLPPPIPPEKPDGAMNQTSPYRRAHYTELAQATAPANEAPAKRTLLDNNPWREATVAPPSAVDHISIHPRLTGGHNSDRKPGDDGIQVIFAPRDAEDHPLQVRGAISIVLVDPELNARSARWEYSLDESQQFFKKSLLGGEAYHLELRWPINAPSNAEQELHVRFTTADGQRHEAQSKIVLQLPGAKVATPKQQPAPRAEVPKRVAGTPTLAPPQYGHQTANQNANQNNDPPPAWTGAELDGPSLAPPQLAAQPARTPAINITVPDVGSVPEAGSDGRRQTIAQRIQQRRSRLRNDSAPSADETGNLALPAVEAPALPGLPPSNLSLPPVNVPNMNMPGNGQPYPNMQQPQPAKPSGWRSWFSTTPSPTAPPATTAAPAYPGAVPDSFVIVPGRTSPPLPQTTVPLNPNWVNPPPVYAGPSVSPLPLLPPTQFSAPPTNEASRTATKPEWKPYR